MLRAPSLIVIPVVAGLAAVAGYALAETGQPLVRSAVYQWNALEPVPTEVGFRRHVVRTRTATLDELESHVTTLNPQQSPHAPHQHPNEEMIVLKEGEVEAYVNGEWVAVDAGGVMFFASNVPHTVRNVSDRPATYYVINWMPPGLVRKSTESR